MEQPGSAEPQHTPRAAGISERIEILDILRGFALFGMLLVHLNGYTSPEYAALGELTSFLLSNKALSIFSMLFGAGFAVQMLRMQATGRPFVRLYLRRMVILFVIGAANWCLVLGQGDVLHTYAIYGVILLLFSRASARTALICAALILTINIWRAPINQALDRALDGPRARQARLQPAARQSAPPLRQRIEEAQRRGSYRQLLALRSEQFWNFHTEPFVWATTLLPNYFFPMFLVGFAAVKSGLAQNVTDRKRYLWRLMWCALAVGLLANPLPYLTLPKLGLPPWVTRVSFLLSGPSLALFYTSSISMAMQNERWRRLLAPLRWPGRMALTNYVAHYAIVITIYYGFGLGLMKRVTTPQAWGLAIAIFLAISLWSAWWLRRFQYGPLEWLWRTLTYGSLAPARVREAPAPATVS